MLDDASEGVRSAGHSDGIRSNGSSLRDRHDIARLAAEAVAEVDAETAAGASTEEASPSRRSLEASPPPPPRNGRALGVARGGLSEYVFSCIIGDASILHVLTLTHLPLKTLCTPVFHALTSVFHLSFPPSPFTHPMSHE